MGFSQNIRLLSKVKYDTMLRPLLKEVYGINRYKMIAEEIRRK